MGYAMALMSPFFRDEIIPILLFFGMFFLIYGVGVPLFRHLPHKKGSMWEEMLNDSWDDGGEEDAQKTAADEAASSEETVTISSFSASDLRTLTWIYQEQSATLNRDEDGNWTLEGSEAAVQATRADSMVTALCSLTSNRVITGADPAQYGMTDPVVTVIYTLADGTENTLYFGDTNPVTGDVYLTVTEDSAVYTVSASKCNVFRYTAAELEDTEQSEAVSGSDSQ